LSQQESYWVVIDILKCLEFYKILKQSMSDFWQLSLAEILQDFLTFMAVSTKNCKVYKKYKKSKKKQNSKVSYTRKSLKIEF